MDQDALNAVADGWQRLDYGWNFQHTLLFDGSVPPTRNEPFSTVYRQRWHLYHSATVLHFVGAKPWRHFCTTPGTRAWVLNMVRTGWYSRAEVAIWLVRWLSKRARFRFGIARRRWRTTLISAGQRRLSVQRSEPANQEEKTSAGTWNGGN